MTASQPAGNRAGGHHDHKRKVNQTMHALASRLETMNATTQQTVTYRILTIRDPRTPGFRWYEIEGRNADTGETWTAAVCDTKDEARDALRAIERGAR